MLHKTRLGLTIQAVGENPHAANTLGIRVIRLRYGVTLFGGAMAGLAGAICPSPIRPCGWRI
ncbi:hypothetical protein P4S72_01145 [Vibrio sp. PP-XX7]